MIRVSKKCGLINTKGEIILKPKFDNILEFNKGFARVMDGNNFGLINNKGDIICAPVTVSKKFGYIDKTGKFIINPQLNTAQDYHEDLAWVSYSEEVVAFFAMDANMDGEGKFVKNPQDYFWPGYFAEGLCFVKFRIGDRVWVY